MAMQPTPFHAYRAQRHAAQSALVDAALAIAESGLPVFPCRADKCPLKDSHGHKDASTDPNIIRGEFGRAGAALIGVPTGRASGWAVVDVDVKDGARGQEWLDANTERLPSTRTHATRSGGWHLVFRMPAAELRNSAGRIAPNIDVRAEGGYVIVPPSTGYHLIPDGPEPAEMPEWLLEAAMKSPQAPQAPHLPAAPYRATEAGTPYGRAALASECDAIRDAPDGQKHATLNRAAFSIGGLVTAGELQESDAFAALADALAAIRPACRDFRAAERTLRRAFDEGKAAPRAVPERPSLPPAEAVHPAAAFLAKIAAARAASASVPLPVARKLMDVPGALRLFVDHCEATAISPQPFLALAAGICLIGALAGRKYRTRTNLRTNIYAVGVADSGAGKDHGRRVVKETLAAANLTGYLGGEDLASGSAIYTALARHPTQLFQIDEFGDWLADVLGQKAPAHKKQIAQRLKTLYSSAGSFLSGTEYADQSRTGRPREDIQQPHACLYGTTTPGQLWAAIAGASLHDGLMARMLVFVSPCSYPDEADPAFDGAPPALIEALQAIAAGPAVEVGNLAGLQSSATAPEPLTVPETAEATAAWRALRKAQLDQQRHAEGTYITAIAGRLAENAMKLALVRAVARDPAAPTIDAGDVAWGAAVAQHCIDTLLREADRNVADSEYERKINRALDIIRRHGPITEAAMVNRRRWRLPEWERSEVLRTLVSSGMVAATRKGGGPGQGQPTTIYSATAWTGTDNDTPSEAHITA